jgi:hypothetical protein
VEDLSTASPAMLTVMCTYFLGALLKKFIDAFSHKLGVNSEILPLCIPFLGGFIYLGLVGLTFENAILGTLYSWSAVGLHESVKK